MAYSLFAGTLPVVSAIIDNTNYVALLFPVVISFNVFYNNVSGFLGG